MEKDTILSNTFTLSALSFSMMNPIEILTILSLTTAVSLNLILIWRQFKKKND